VSKGFAPRPVEVLLNWAGTGLIARLALSSAYLLGGVVKLTNFPGAVAEQAHFGMPYPTIFAILTIAVELIGPALIFSGRLVWLGAGMLGVFTALAAITANAFWTMPTGPERFGATNAFFEHLGLVGGFILTALLARCPD
jgi:uncharacterized membrane protein YphA (DoxX/SURF4 family)